MKKLFLRISVALVFMTALLVNVSINANKGTGDTTLFGIISSADACEEYRDGYSGGVCRTSGNCYRDAGSVDCKAD